MRREFNSARSRWLCSCFVLLLCLVIFLSTKFLTPFSNAFAEQAGEQSLSQSDSNLLAEASRLSNKVRELYKMGKAEEALPLAKRVLAIREQVLGPTHLDTASSLNDLGMLLQAMGNLKGAKSYLIRVLEINEKTLDSNHLDIAASLDNLGNLLRIMGDFSGARSYLERALTIRKQKFGLKHLETAKSLDKLGCLLRAVGDFTDAKSYLESALAIRKQTLVPTHLDIARSENSLGNLLRDMGDLAGAKPHLESALAIRKQTLPSTHPETVSSLNNLGSLLRAMGDLAGAKPYLEHALAIRKQTLPSTHPDIARSENSLGNLLWDMGDLAGAKPYYERALAIFEHTLGPNHSEIAIFLSNMGWLLLEMGDKQEAIKFFSRALEVEERSLAATLAIGTEAQKRALLKTLVRTSYTAVSLLAHSMPRDGRVLCMATTTILRRKGRALDATVEGLKFIRADENPVSQVLIEKFNMLRAQWAFLQLHSPEELTPEEHRKRIAGLEKELQTIESQLSTESAAFQKTLTPVTLEEVQTQIPTRAALVEFYAYKLFDAKAKPGQRWGRPNYFAYVLQRSGAPRWVDLGSTQDIDQAAEALRESVKTLKEDVLERAQELDALTMAKIRPLLGDAEILLISPDGALNLVPFAALVDESGKYLIENYQLSYVTSGRDLLRMDKDSEAREKPLLVGDADFHGVLGAADTRSDGLRSADMTKLSSFDPLPGTAGEVREIGQLLKLSQEQVLTKEQATEAAVKTVKGPEILHLATHGFFLPDIPEEPLEPWSDFNQNLQQKPYHLIEDPLLRSGLALSGFNRRNEAKSANDGVLTALEVAGLDLWGTEIVALSACETGIGEVSNGEGVFGLRRALVLAGAQSQLMTLWSVSDEPTKDLMVSWYGQLMEGKGRADALRQIQLAALKGKPLPVIESSLRSNRGVVYVKSSIDPRIVGTRHPFFWASLILSGATGPIHGTTK